VGEITDDTKMTLFTAGMPPDDADALRRDKVRL